MGDRTGRWDRTVRCDEMRRWRISGSGEKGEAGVWIIVSRLEIGTGTAKSGTAGRCGINRKACPPTSRSLPNIFNVCLEHVY